MALLGDLQTQLKGVVERSNQTTAAKPAPISPTISVKSDPTAAPRLDLDEPAVSPASEEPKTPTDDAAAASSTDAPGGSTDTAMVPCASTSARDKAVQDSKPVSPRGHNSGALGRTLDKKDSNTSNQPGHSNRSMSGHSETKDKRGSNAQRMAKTNKKVATVTPDAV